MKNVLHVLLVIPMLVFLFSCSTTGRFKLPPNTTLQVTDRMVAQDENGEWKTSPFFWSKAGGADFRLIDANGKVVRSGKLKMKFRVVSIFWPPAALIYWPMGLADVVYDLTKPSDGLFVRDYPVSVRYGEEAQPQQETAPAKKPAPKKGK